MFRKAQLFEDVYYLIFCETQIEWYGNVVKIEVRGVFRCHVLEHHADHFWAFWVDVLVQEDVQVVIGLHMSRTDVVDQDIKEALLSCCFGLDDVYVGGLIGCYICVSEFRSDLKEKLIM